MYIYNFYKYLINIYWIQFHINMIIYILVWMISTYISSANTLQHTMFKQHILVLEDSYINSVIIRHWGMVWSYTYKCMSIIIASICPRYVSCSDAYHLVMSNICIMQVHDIAIKQNYIITSLKAMKYLLMYLRINMFAYRIINNSMYGDILCWL